MSDTTVDNGRRADSGQRVDKKRTLASLAAAIALHGVMFAAFAFGIGIASGPPVTPPVTIDLLAAEEPGMDGAGAPGGGAGGSAAAGAGGTVPAVAGLPVAAAPAAAAAPSAGGKGADASGFVIPTPRAQPSDTTPAASAPAFRETGGRTGVVQGIPSVPSTVPAPAVAPVQQGKGAGSAASSGSGASSAQRSGTGVLVTGSSESTSGGKVDLGALDKSLASAAGKGAGKPGGAGAGGAGSGAAAGAGGSGSTASGGTGGGSGSGTGSGQISWEGAEAGKGRTLVYSVSPKLPARVSAQGLSLSVTVSFTLLSDGLIGSAVVQHSSGYTDVDAAVLAAIRRWRFTPAEGATPVRGFIPYIIRAR